MKQPVTDLDTRFSDEDAVATDWEETRRALEDAELFWISTVRADGRPHVTPLVAVWLDDALYFATGPGEQKAVNLRTNQNVTLTTGCNGWERGLDIVVEGEAVQVRDESLLDRLAATWATKWDGRWQYEAHDRGFRHEVWKARSSCSPCSPPRCSRSPREPSARRAIDFRCLKHNETRVGRVTLQRMDNVGIVVESLDAAISFFAELGLELEGRATVEGEWAGRVTGLGDQRVEIAMMRTPDGHSRLELSRFLTPPPVADHRNAPVNALGYLRVMFAVDDIDDTLARLRKNGAQLVGEVVQYEDVYRLCYIRGPEGLLIGLAEQIG